VKGRFVLLDIKNKKSNIKIMESALRILKKNGLKIQAINFKY